MRNAKTFCFFIILLAASEILCCYLPSTDSGDACDDLEQYIMSREIWRAEEPSGQIECMRSPAEYVIIHHTVTSSCSTHKSCATAMRKMQKEHKKEKGWPDVGYHFVIGGDGKAYVGRPWYKMGGHTKNHNRKSIGIAFIGDYNKDCPGPEMLDLVPKIVYCGVEQGYIHPNFFVIGHRDAYCSSCPGDALYDVVKKWTRFPKAVPIPSYTCDNTKATFVPEKPPSTELSTAKTTSTTVQATSGDSRSIESPVYYYLLLSGKPLTCCIK